MKKTDNNICKRLLLNVAIFYLLEWEHFFQFLVIIMDTQPFILPDYNNNTKFFSGNDTFVIGLFTLNIFPYMNASTMDQLIKV